jgi:hypothetical protein
MEHHFAFRIVSSTDVNGLLRCLISFHGLEDPDSEIIMVHVPWSEHVEFIPRPEPVFGRSHMLHAWVTRCVDGVDCAYDVVNVEWASNLPDLYPVHEYYDYVVCLYPRASLRSLGPSECGRSP